MEQLVEVSLDRWHTIFAIVGVQRLCLCLQRPQLSEQVGVVSITDITSRLLAGIGPVARAPAALAVGRPVTHGDDTRQVDAQTEQKACAAVRGSTT